MTSFIYILELNGGNWYVGSTTNLQDALLQHVHRPTGWVRKHGWTGRYEAYNVLISEERWVTIAMMRRFGKDKVRGACWLGCMPLVSDPHLSPPIPVTCLGTMFDLRGQPISGNPTIAISGRIRTTTYDDDGDVRMREN